MKVFSAVRAAKEQMTKTENMIATCFLMDPQDFAFETLETVAARLGTSTPSVIRFCRRLGFSGYKAFQEAVRNELKNGITLPDKLSRALNEDWADSGFAITAGKAISCIEQTLNNLDERALQTAAEAVMEAKRVFCFGLKESFALAHYAYTRFLTLRPGVFMLSAGQGGEIESVLTPEKGDVCIFFLFHRYTRQSPRILKLLKERGVKIILITSPPFDEVEEDAEILLPCAVNVGGIKNSAVAPVCITDHLCNAALKVGGETTLEYMKQSELLFKEFVL